MPWTSRSPGFAASWRSGIARRHGGRVAARASVAYSLGLEATPRATRKVYNRQNGDRRDHCLSQPETHPLHVRGRRRGDWVHCAGSAGPPPRLEYKARPASTAQGSADLMGGQCRDWRTYGVHRPSVEAPGSSSRQGHPQDGLRTSRPVEALRESLNSDSLGGGVTADSRAIAGRGSPASRRPMGDSAGSRCASNGAARFRP